MAGKNRGFAKKSWGLKEAENAQVSRTWNHGREPGAGGGPGAGSGTARRGCRDPG